MCGLSAACACRWQAKDIPEEKGQCCNSCGDVKAVYQQKMLSRLKWEGHPLCEHEAVLLDPARLAEIHEGCNLFGFLEARPPRPAPSAPHRGPTERSRRRAPAREKTPGRRSPARLPAPAQVNKVAGNFHVAPGKAFQSPQGQLVHEFKPFDTHTYNVSHVIHSLSFGVHYPNRVNPCAAAAATAAAAAAPPRPRAPPARTPPWRHTRGLRSCPAPCP